MKTITRIILSSALIVLGFASQFARAAYLENPSQISTVGMLAPQTVGMPAPHVKSKRVRAPTAIDVNAYARGEVPASAPASVDFGIGSQR